jgi:hypothetical protein
MTSSAQSTLYSRVLVKVPGFYRLFGAPDGRSAIRYDPASLSYVVEELVSLSALEIAITPLSPARFYLNDLSPILRQRVVVLDENNEARDEMRAFLGPIFREFGLTVNAMGVAGERDRNPKDLIDAMAVILPATYDFFLAARNRVQFEVDIARFRHSLEIVKRHSSDADARAHIAAMLGVLNTYHKVQAPSLFLASAATQVHEQQFRDLVEDLAYRSLSEDAALLGIPADVKRAVRLMGRALERVMKIPLLAAGARAGTKAVLAGSGLKGVDLDLANVIAPRGYFPPIVSLSAALTRAEPTWRSQLRPAFQLGLYPKLSREGFVEQPIMRQPTMEDFQQIPLENQVTSPDSDA